MKHFLNYLDTILPPSDKKHLLQHMTTPLHKSVTIVPHRITPHNIQQDTKANGRQRTTTPFQLLHTHYLDRAIREPALGATRLHQCGYIYIQEVAASMPATLIESQAGDTILDMCAAPGGKSIQLASHMLATYPDNPGCVRSNDPDRARAKTLQNNICRTGCYNTMITTYDGTKIGQHHPEKFDHILLDAPCSGEGTRFKSSAALDHRHPSQIKQIANLQYDLLVSAATACKIGGTITYSTCTLNHRENEANIARIIATYPQLQVIPISIPNTNTGLACPTTHTTHTRDHQLTDHVIRCRPHTQHTGGFFIAQLRKTASISHTKPPHSPKNKKKEPKNTTQAHKTITKRLHTAYGITLTPEETIIHNPHTKHYHLTTKQAHTYSQTTKQFSLGIPIAKDTRSGPIPLHHLATTLGTRTTHNTLPITADQAQTYSQKKSITLPSTETHNKFPILTHNTLPISITKHIDTTAKNKFPNF